MNVPVLCRLCVSVRVCLVAPLQLQQRPAEPGGQGVDRGRRSHQGRG